MNFQDFNNRGGLITGVMAVAMAVAVAVAMAVAVAREPREASKKLPGTRTIHFDRISARGDQFWPSSCPKVWYVAMAGGQEIGFLGMIFSRKNVLFFC